jgi:hypothetical protein
MLTLSDILQIALILLVMSVMFLVLRARKRGKATHDLQFAHDNVCQHLRPALDLLLSRNNAIDRVGMKAPEMPLEIHFKSDFDPQAIYAELQLTEPVYVSERRVLYCKEDWCELHPPK